jgi:hypothetical protein
MNPKRIQLSRRKGWRMPDNMIVEYAAFCFVGVCNHGPTVIPANDDVIHADFAYRHHHPLHAASQSTCSTLSASESPTMNIVRGGVLSFGPKARSWSMAVQNPGAKRQSDCEIPGVFKSLNGLAESVPAVVSRTTGLLNFIIVMATVERSGSQGSSCTLCF